MEDNYKTYDLLAYIAASAKEMYIDPQVYAPLRFLSVMLRLLDMQTQNMAFDQLFLTEVRQMILENRSLLLDDREHFGYFLDQLIMKIAEKNFSI